MESPMEKALKAQASMKKPMTKSAAPDIEFEAPKLRSMAKQEVTSERRRSNIDQMKAQLAER